MTAREKFVHQAAPLGPVVEFSNAPIKVHGVKYRPRWTWSTGYRKHFRTAHGRVRQDASDATMMRRYVRHMAEQRGFENVDEAVKALHASGSVATEHTPGPWEAAASA